MAGHIQGLEALLNKLRDRASKAANDGGAVIVGYTAASAVYVHEFADPKTLGAGVNRPSGLGHYWGPADYGPKFLERPAREMSNDGTFREILVKAMRAGKKLMQGLLLCGLRLQRESQQRVPVEYGNLRASAFTRVEGGAAVEGADEA